MSNYSPFIELANVGSLNGSPVNSQRQNTVTSMQVSSNTSLWTGTDDNGSPSVSPAKISSHYAAYAKRDGIVIDTNLSETQINGLDMSGFRFKRLPFELFQFSFLSELRLANNLLSVLPAEVGLLRTLTCLDVSGNQLTAVPRELCKLTNLTELYLYNNQISMLPPELGYLYQLEEFGLEGNPIVEPILSVMHSQGAIMVIPFLRDHLINTTPPMERFWHSLDQYNADVPGSASFTVLTYNILAEKYATPQMYGYVPSWALVWDYRKQMILHEVLSYDADIICLQEVEANQFEQYFKPQLRMRGSYDGIFYPKSRAKTMNDWDRTFVDGCAIFFKSDRFKLEERHLIEFNQLALARPSLRKHKDVYNRVMTRDNIAIVARLTHVESKQSILVSTVHIHWDPSHKDVKLVQAIMLVEELERLLRKNAQSALVLCGDFNALIESGVGEFLENGVLAAGHDDFGSYTYEPYSTEGAVHSLSLKNAYSLLSDEPLTFTNFTPIFCGTIDYVWFKPSNLSVTGLLGSVSGEYVKQFAGFPTQHMPSDHVPLLVEFKIEPFAPTSSAAPGMQIPMHQPVLGSSSSGLGLMPYGGANVSAASAFSLPHVPTVGPSSSSSSTSAAMAGSNSSANSRRLYSRNKSTMS